MFKTSEEILERQREWEDDLFKNNLQGWWHAKDHNGYPPEYQPGDQLDPVDEAYYNTAVPVFTAKTGPQVGDIVRDATGREYRLDHMWQTNTWQLCNAGFYLVHEGYMYATSGSMYNSISPADLKETGEVKDALAWFGHHGYVKAYSGVWVKVPCRVWQWDGICWHSKYEEDTNL